MSAAASWCRTANAKDQLDYVVYDNNGRTRFTLKATGSSGWTISENRYDANGNVIEARRYESSCPNARVAAIDSVSSPGITVPEIQNELSTTLGYSDATPTTLAGVQRTRFAYDANNRLRFTVDPSGSVAESVYDAAGNVVSHVRFAARPTLTEYTETAINAAVNRTDADNQVTRRLRCGGSTALHRRCARLGQRETVRRAGQCRQNGALGDPPDADAVQRKRDRGGAGGDAGHGNDEVTRLVYDTGNRLRFTIDALGSVSEKAYDAVGNVIVTTRFAGRPSGIDVIYRERGRCGGRTRCAAMPTTRSPVSPTTRQPLAVTPSMRSARSVKRCTTPSATSSATVRWATAPDAGDSTPETADCGNGA